MFSLKEILNEAESFKGNSLDVLIWLGLASLGLSLLLTPCLRDLFRFFGWLDQPDLDRKFHSHPIPRAGGAAIALAYLASFVLVQATIGIADQRLALVWKVLPAAAVMFAVGVIDDLVGLKPWQKLFGQLVACGIACSAGIVILDIIGKHERAWWSIPITVLWLLASSNAFNLVDGMDGLAGGAGLFATLTIFVAALLQTNMALAMATIALAGCLLGFLRYNFAPATVFLGDSGSLVIGFLLGCYGIIWTQKSATILAMTAPVMALSIPLLDVGLAILRRFLRRQPIFSADRGHIHHRLLDRGMSPRQAALILYALCSVVAVFSLLYSHYHNNRIASVIVVVFCAIAWMGIQYLGYAEFTFAGRLLFRGDLQRTLKVQLDLHSFERAMAGSPSPEACAKLIIECSEQFGFRVTRMQVSGETFLEPFGCPEPVWEARVALDAGDFIELAKKADDHVVSASGGPFLDALRRSLRAVPGCQPRHEASMADSEAAVW